MNPKSPDRKARFAAVILCLVTVCGLIGCGTSGTGSGASGLTKADSDASSVTREFYAMDTVMDITVRGQDEDDAEQSLDAAESEIERIDALLTSVMGSMTGDSATQSVEVQIDALLERAMELSDLTDGAFDPTVYPLVKAWGFYSGDYQVPDEDTLSALLAHVGHEKWESDPEVQLDLGAIGKGYAASRAKEVLLESGVTSAVLSLGGNVSLLGTKPDGSDWKVAIQDPEDESGIIATVTGSDTAVVTSGSYERYFEQDGVIYSHILDPSTGHPVDNSLLSVTIVAEDDVLADALSTAMFVMGKDDALDFWRSGVAEFDMILVEKDRSITITEGLKDCFGAADKKAEVNVETR